MEPHRKTNHEGREVQVAVLKLDVTLINDAGSEAKLGQKTRIKQHQMVWEA